MNPLDQHYRKILIFLILVILAGNAYWIVRHFKPELFLGEPHLNVGVEIEKASSNEPKERQPLEVQPPKVVVHVVGAVQSPGVYQIEMGARINDAVKLAGGATDEADLNQLNLAAKVRDEEQIFVPSKLSETVSPPSSPVRSSVPTPQSPTGRSFPTARQPINLNTATSKQLQTVPGIGPVTAQRIIDYRRTHGRFSTVDDLIEVKGIGQKTLEEIRVHVVAR